MSVSITRRSALAGIALGAVAAGLTGSIAYGKGAPKAPADKVVDAAIVDSAEGSFQRFTYAGAGGKTLAYDLYVPAGADLGGDGTYPLVVVLEDIDDDGIAADKPLVRTVAADTWAGADFQKVTPCFVLGPESDDEDDAALIAGIVAAVCDEYPVDANRVYLAPQGDGIDCAFNLMLSQPDQFAAALMAGGDIDEELWGLFGLADQRFWMFYSADDAEAVQEVGAFAASLANQGGQIALGAWSAADTAEQQDAAAAAQIAEGAPIMITELSDVPVDGAKKADDEAVDAATMRAAFAVAAVRDWLLANTL